VASRLTQAAGSSASPSDHVTTSAKCCVICVAVSSVCCVVKVRSSKLVSESSCSCIGQRAQTVKQAAVRRGRSKRSDTAPSPTLSDIHSRFLYPKNVRAAGKQIVPQVLGEGLVEFSGRGQAQHSSHSTPVVSVLDTAEQRTCPDRYVIDTCVTNHTNFLLLQLKS
jgi:hypothetical protein